MTGNKEIILPERNKILVHRIMSKIDNFSKRELLDDEDVKEVFSEVISLDKIFVLDMLEFLRQVKFERERQEAIVMYQIEIKLRNKIMMKQLSKSLT